MRTGTGLFYAGYGAILTPAFGVVEAYGGNTTELNNALGFFMICELRFSRTRHKSHVDVKTVWTIFALVFLVASLPTNLVYIAIFFTVVMGFLLVASSYFALADGNAAASLALKKGGGGFCFVSGLIGW
jgi:succinate-acetate transporter protein